MDDLDKLGLLISNLTNSKVPSMIETKPVKEQESALDQKVAAKNPIDSNVHLKNTSQNQHDSVPELHFDLNAIAKSTAVAAGTAVATGKDISKNPKDSDLKVASKNTQNSFPNLNFNIEELTKSNKKVKSNQVVSSLRAQKIAALNVIPIYKVSKMSSVSPYNVKTPDDPMERINALMGSNEGFFNPIDRFQCYEKKVKWQAENIRDRQASTILSTMKKVHEELLISLNINSDGFFRDIDLEVSETVKCSYEMTSDDDDSQCYDCVEDIKPSDMDKYSNRLNEQNENAIKKFNHRYENLCMFVKHLPENIVFDLGFYEPSEKYCFCPCHKKFRHERNRISSDMAEYLEKFECSKGRMDSVALLQHLQSRDDIAHRAAYLYLCFLHGVDPNHTVSSNFKKFKHYDMKTNR